MLSHQITRGDRKDKPSSFNKDLNHLISAAVLARALYSAYVLYRATVACFLQLHEMRFLPKKTQKLPVDRRSSLLPAQLALENA